MTPSARQSAIIELYDAIETMAKPSDQVMQAYFRQRKFIGSKDRKFIASMIYDLLRHTAHLQWWVDRCDLESNARSKLLVWLACAEGCSLQQIDDIFDGQGYAPEPLNNFEAQIVEALIDESFDHEEMPLSIRSECPEWAYQGLVKNFPTNFQAQMSALQREAPLDLRVNTLKENVDIVFKKLKDDGMDVAKTDFSPLCLRVQGRPAFSVHPLYQQGKIEVQDEGSQLLALMCGVKSGEWVVDFCAGAGGKTMALAALMQNKGRIWACDVDSYRLENARKRLRRADIHCVEMVLLDDEQDDWVRKHDKKADCVLIDAPCSGMGTWRRNPYARWQNLGPSLEQLVTLQQKILVSAARLLKSNGRLLYATCSMLPQENQNQISTFLKNNRHFKPLSLDSLWAKNGYPLPNGLDLSKHELQLTPFDHQTDGFYIAAMQRIE